MPKVAKAFAKLGKEKIALSATASINAKGELMLYGDIGDWWEGLDASSIVQQIAYLDSPAIIVRIHSSGGNVMEGLAMYNALKQHEKPVHVYIDGIAASMGAGVAMAGDKIFIPANGLMMLHKPWLYAEGNSNDLRDIADNLDQIEASYIQIHADKTGKSFDEIKALIADGKNHFFRGQEAIDYGLADELTAAVEVSGHADFKSLNLPTQAAKALFKDAKASDTTEETEEEEEETTEDSTDESETETQAADETTEEEDEETETTASASTNNSTQINDATASIKPKKTGVNTMPQQALDAVAQERTRVKEIRTIAAQASLDTSWLNDRIDNGATIEEARKDALDAVAQRDSQNAPNNSHSRFTNDVAANLQSNIAHAIMARINPAKVQHTEASAQLRGHTLLDYAKAMLDAKCIDYRGKNKMEIAALAMHTTSDFPLILMEVANKVLKGAYAAEQRTFTSIARRSSASDFRAKHSLELGSGSELKKVNQKGEFERGTVSEGKEAYKIETFGRIFDFSRQLLINDDVGAIEQFFRTVGNSAARLEQKTVWDLILSNPKLADNKSLFHADHGNLVSSGTHIVTDGLSAMRKLMRKQKGLDDEVLNIMGKTLVVNSDRETEAQQMLTSIVANQTNNVNVFANSLDLVVEPRLDDVANNPFYMFADPAVEAVIEYAYLEDQTEPYIETKMGFETDGMSLKVRHDFGAGAVGHRGAVKNPGASAA